ncbi:TPA: GNAT family N-acetyltransferase [Thermoplasmata archaeon]|nr:GNAT family N-acetyltransferase [Thermoplasmata archaeon]
MKDRSWVMEDWQKRFKEKVRTVESAISTIRRGDKVFIGSGAAEPQLLVKALIESAGRLADTRIMHIMTLGVAPYTEEKFTDQFRHNAFFIGANTRQAIAEGRADYTPVFLSEIPALFKTGQSPIDVALIQVSLPDKYGYCSYGVSTDVVKSAAENATKVIAEVNTRMPRALGDCFINMKDIDYVVPVDEPLLTSHWDPPNDIARRIGRNIANLIDDGSTLQMGIGAIPDSVLDYLSDKKDLGIHTEMFSDGFMDLAEMGVINNAQKTLHPGKTIASFCLGSEKLYDFVDNNPSIEFHPTEHTNDPFIVAQNDKMIAINSAIEVDLTGQVCADSLGPMFYSGIGGQVDFVRGSSRSKGGKPIIALPSTAKNDTISRIVATLKPGAGVVTSRGDVHYVVTEWGVAYLHGKNIRERAMALISVAHPKFRKQLLTQAKKLSYVYKDQILPETGVYPEEVKTTMKTGDGTSLAVRPIRPTDEEMMSDMFYDLSDQTIINRFFSMLKSMPHRKLQEFCCIDYENDMSLVVIHGKSPRQKMVGVGSYHLNPATNRAEIAFLVADDWQGKGIGTFLMEYLVKIAKSKKIAGFTAEVMRDNVAMIALMHKAGVPPKSTQVDGGYLFSMDF